MLIWVYKIDLLLFVFSQLFFVLSLDMLWYACLFGGLLFNYDIVVMIMNESCRCS